MTTATTAPTTSFTFQGRTVTGAYTDVNMAELTAFLKSGIKADGTGSYSARDLAFKFGAEAVASARDWFSYGTDWEFGLLVLHVRGAFRVWKRRLETVRVVVTKGGAVYALAQSGGQWAAFTKAEGGETATELVSYRG